MRNSPMSSVPSGSASRCGGDAGWGCIPFPITSASAASRHTPRAPHCHPRAPPRARRAHSNAGLALARKGVASRRPGDARVARGRNGLLSWHADYCNPSRPRSAAPGTGAGGSRRRLQHRASASARATGRPSKEAQHQQKCGETMGRLPAIRPFCAGARAGHVPAVMVRHRLCSKASKLPGAVARLRRGAGRAADAAKATIGRRACGCGRARGRLRALPRTGARC